MNDPLERALLQRDRLWGRFVAILRGGERDVAVYRDPSGALDPFIWPIEGGLIIASELPRALPRNARPAVRVNWDAVRYCLNHTPAAHAESPLHGVSGLAPGAVCLWDGQKPVTRQLWRPADHFSQPELSIPAYAAGLRAALEAVLDAYSAEGELALAECSGGFDSSVVASGLVSHGQTLRTLVNYATTDFSGDERPFADAVAAHLQLPLAMHFKTMPNLSPGTLSQTADGFRPSFTGMDAAYEHDLLAICQIAGAKRVYTGHGGDSVFFQLTTPMVMRDRVLRMGLAAFNPREIGRLARWSRRSAYEIIAIGANLRAARPAAAARTPWITEATTLSHPWLEGLEYAGPAKRFQILSLLHSLDRNGLSRLDGAIDLVHPLMAQPLLETALAIPCDLFVYGGRGRALARKAFRDWLPNAVYTRRSKGELGAFYARALVPALPGIVEFLKEGRLAAERLIEPDRLAEALDENTLANEGNFAAVLRAVALEAWTRRWSP